MKSHIEKPTIYLPTRILIVPCDYEPMGDKVNFVEVKMRARYRIANPRYLEDVRIKEFIERHVTTEQPITFFGAKVGQSEDKEVDPILDPYRVLATASRIMLHELKLDDYNYIDQYEESAKPYPCKPYWENNRE